MKKLFRMRSSKRNDIDLQEGKNSSGATVSLGEPLHTASGQAGRFTWTSIIRGAIEALLTAMLAAFVGTTGFPTMLVQATLSIP